MGSNYILCFFRICPRNKRITAPKQCLLTTQRPDNPFRMPMIILDLPNNFSRSSRLLIARPFRRDSYYVRFLVFDKFSFFPSELAFSVNFRCLKLACSLFALLTSLILTLLSVSLSNSIKFDR